jgi:UDP-N-acetylmuramyl pentapeptide phosphotransferase/UDP-N-acetylglucosamine-1-phosphate transferase
MILLFCLIQECLFSILAVHFVRYAAEKRELLDVPNERSMHARPVPRLGGAAFGPIILLGTFGWLYFYGGLSLDVMAMLIGGLAIYILGILDDVMSLGSTLRLTIQGVVAAGFLFVARDGMPSSHGPANILWYIFLWVWIVGVTNAYNFMDGIDGMAGVQAVVMGVYWIFAQGDSGKAAAISGACMAGAVIGFLYFNRPPARVFMGDAGSTLLGFLIAVFPVAQRQVTISREQCFAAALIPMMPFVLDTGLTLLKRLRAGENIFTAHRSHLYQRLAARTKSHVKVTSAYFALAAVGAIFGHFLADNGFVVLSGALLVEVALFFALSFRDK